MSSSLLERARGFHEDLEIYERAIIEQLENKPRTQKVSQSGRSGSPSVYRPLLFATGFFHGRNVSHVGIGRRGGLLALRSGISRDKKVC